MPCTLSVEYRTKSKLQDCISKIEHFSKPKGAYDARDSVRINTFFLLHTNLPLEAT